MERELLSTFKDQSIIVLADWLKVRGTLKGWTKLWCILKPGLLLLYRSPKAKVQLPLFFFFFALIDAAAAPILHWPLLKTLSLIAEQPLDRHHHSLHVRVDREALQKGWLLLQALPPHGPKRLGCPGPRRRGHRGRGAALAHVTLHFQSSQCCGGAVLDGRIGAGLEMLVALAKIHEQRGLPTNPECQWGNRVSMLEKNIKMA